MEQYVKKDSLAFQERSFLRNFRYLWKTPSIHRPWHGLTTVYICNHSGGFFRLLGYCKPYW